MGEVITKKAARTKIMEDVKITVTRATARAALPGGAHWGAAQERLGPIILIWDAAEAKYVAAQTEAKPLVAAVGARNLFADDIVKGIADAIWNALGRPANDPLFELLFPGGSGLYVDGDVHEQPDLMVLLAELLESNLDPRLAAIAPAHAAALRDAAAPLEAAVEATRKPSAKVLVYGRMLTAVARVAQVELAKLKRYWRGADLSEADIHTVIPDRPRSYGVPVPIDTTDTTDSIAPNA